MTRDQQLEEWANGNSIHVDGEGCVPDCSCCRKGVQASEEDRKRFVGAYKVGDDATVEILYKKFIQALFVKKE